MKLVIASLTLVLGIACSSKPADTTGDDGGPTADSSGGGSCNSALQCPDGQVCNPATGECAGDVACTAHAQCGAAAYCGPNGSCVPSTTGSPCDNSDNCLPEESCLGNGYCGCGGEVYQAESVPPNMLIVLDRSGSMNENAGTMTKWVIAKQAITGLTTMYDEQVRFGLMLYPGLNQRCTTGSRCNAGAVFVDVNDSASSSINTFLADARTCSLGTPTAETLSPLRSYAGLEDTTRPNYVLLITDGQSTCADPVAQVTALRNETPEIKTFVIGFGAGVDPTELNAMAMAGGTARPSSPYYYQADDAESLMSAFTTIAGSVLSCSYALSEEPPDPDKLYVYFDGVSVMRDTTHAAGWDYDAATGQVVLYGSACDSLRAGGVTDLDIVYGCPLIVD